MVRKLSNLEKEFVEIRKEQIKEENSFSSKTFFTITSIIVGGLFLYLKNDTGNLDKTLAALIVLGISLFVLQVWGATHDIKWSYHNLMVALKSGKLKDYEIKRTSWYNKILFGLSIGLLSSIFVIILTSNFLASIITGVVIAIVFIFSKRSF
ncbi:MAG: hypothetical protein KKH88_02135 [Nanoarchaeota archaeon]|nr:hypothetical protein [Nanoarchaeota archaeon]